jgi:Fur family ferric uptake transcriptional regulator
MKRHTGRKEWVMNQEKGAFDATLAQVKAKGERLTVQRRLVIEALCERSGHLTIHDVQQSLQCKHVGQNIPESTTYRILQWLKDLQVVSQTDMGMPGIVYELHNHPHHHLICLRCGAITDIEDNWLVSLRQSLSDEYGFTSRIDHMAFYGYCRNCAE